MIKIRLLIFVLFYPVFVLLLAIKEKRLDSLGEIIDVYCEAWTYLVKGKT